MSDEKTAKRRVTLRDVAQAAGVSLKTASNVINGSGRMTDETRAKVETVIKDLGYRVNVAARNLNRDHTGFITLAVPSLIPPYLADSSRSGCEDRHCRCHRSGLPAPAKLLHYFEEVLPSPAPYVRKRCCYTPSLRRNKGTFHDGAGCGVLFQVPSS